MSDVLERLIALEERVAALEGRHPKSIRRREAEVRIITGPAARGRSPLLTPSDAELRQLYAIVLGKYPRLGPRAPEKTEHFDAFQKAFRALAGFGRADAPDLKHAATFWVDRIEERIRADGGSGAGLGLPAVTTAVVAHGDVPFAPLDRFPYDLAFGLRDGEVGMPARDGWRKVLAI